MITYLLIEDRKNKWQEFQRILDETCRDLIPHGNNKFLSDFGEIEENLYQAILSGNIDLIISDISLGYDTKDETTYITRLLRNIVKRLEDTGLQVLSRKGVGLILITQFDEDTLANIISKDKPFLDEHFLYWSFFESEDFDDNIEMNIEKFRRSFKETRIGWYRNDLFVNYTDTIAQQRLRFPLAKPTTIIARDVIAVTRTKVIYLNDGRITTESHGRDINDFLQETGTYRITAGRMPNEEFYRIQESIYFLHIRERKPFTVINLNHAWRIGNLNKGRELSLRIGHDAVTYNCSFPMLNDFLDGKFP